MSFCKLSKSFWNERNSTGSVGTVAVKRGFCENSQISFRVPSSQSQHKSCASWCRRLLVDWYRDDVRLMLSCRWRPDFLHSCAQSSSELGCVSPLKICFLAKYALRIAFANGSLEFATGSLKQNKLSWSARIVKNFTDDLKEEWLERTRASEAYLFFYLTLCQPFLFQHNTVKIKKRIIMKPTLTIEKLRGRISWTFPGHLFKILFNSHL